MIITVKTLDSQNHQFTVDDDYTVEQFKAHIEDRVNIPAARQRIIYCGRVLQDNAKLTEYDVDGKVVHLVQRAPPSATSRNTRSVTPPPDLNRARGGFRGFDRVGGNAVYMGMGSMAFPQGLMEHQQRIPPRATHTLSSSRLNVARRMLRSAESVIRQLENPSGNNEQPPPEEHVEEEMTPVIEARVIVPSNGGQPIDENAIVNAVENTIFASGVGNLDAGLGPSTSAATQNNDVTSSQPSNSSTPEAASTPRSASAENVNAEPISESSRDGLRPSRIRCRGTEMAELLTTLNQLQARFAPFLTQYQTFMQEDPQVSQENVQETRQMLTRVSQVLHYLGHAYHSLSDIMINVDQPPPRLLLCRPILIQHSAVVQAGIPIQVEAQINLSADRPGSTTTSTGATTSTTTNTTTAESAPTSNATPNTTPNGQNQPGGPPNITLQPGFVGLPFMPAGSMRVITTPLEFHSLRPNASRSRPPNNNNNTTPAAPPEQPTSQNVPSGTQSSSSGANGQQGQQGAGQNQGGAFAANNGNLEFFMEVTPEVLRGGNLIQSLMQLVGSQLGGNLGPPQAPSQPPGQATSSTGDTTPQNSQATNGQAQNFSQSQARSTQTNPTTSTHTRSTPRPHVHMTQQAVQGGFDPFLPCYSHHVTHSRGQRIVSLGPQQQHQPNRQESAAARDTLAGQTLNPPSAPPNQQIPPQAGANSQPNLDNIAAQFEDFFSNRLSENLQTAQMMAEAVTNAMRAARNPSMHTHQQGVPQRGAPDGQGAHPLNHHHTRTQQDILGFISRLMGQNLPDLLGNGPTLDQYVQSLHPEPYVQGESLIIDLIMLMLRSLRLNDLIMISSGNMTPLHRQLDTIQSFFLTEVCQNDTTDAGIDRATQRIMNDFRPLINALESIPPREDIDMVATIDGFFRQRLPGIIRLAIAGGGNTTNSANLLSVIWRAAKELLALALHCSANGQQGVETVCEEVMFSTILNQSNIPSDIHTWTIANSRTALRTIIQNLDVRPTEIEQYVVRNAAIPLQGMPVNAEPQEEHQERKEENSEVESMEVDYLTSPTNEEPIVESAPIRVEDTEPLPNVIWGSESWHRQTPEDWVPIITRDVQKQRRQNPQPPFSDAYLSGMPSKRRKLINNSKPQGSLSQVISDSVRQAVTATGLTSVAPLEAVTQAAGQSADIQAAYRSLLQSTVQANLRENEDFTPERFPNAANYFNRSPPE